MLQALPSGSTGLVCLSHPARVSVGFSRPLLLWASAPLSPSSRLLPGAPGMWAGTGLLAAVFFFDGRAVPALSQAPRLVRAGPLPGSRAFRDCSWVLCGLGQREVGAVALPSSLSLLSSAAQHCWRLESQQSFHEDRPSAFSLVSTQG